MSKSKAPVVSFTPGMGRVEITLYAAYLIDVWHRQGLSYRTISKLWGIKHSQAQHVHGLTSGIGMQTQLLLAQMKDPALPNGGFGGSWDALLAHAKAWYASEESATWRARAKKVASARLLARVGNG